MAYDEYDEHTRGLDRSSELYDEDLYETEDFGERLDRSSLDDDDMLADDSLADESLADDDTIDTDADTAQVEEGFGESITSNPHLEDQLKDEQLNQEAEADYSDHKDESLLDKAKDKFDELTGRD
jgi:hypothetical protein